MKDSGPKPALCLCCTNCLQPDPKNKPSISASLPGSCQGCAGLSHFLHHRDVKKKATKAETHHRDSVIWPQSSMGWRFHWKICFWDRRVRWATRLTWEWCFVVAPSGGVVSSQCLRTARVSGSCWGRRFRLWGSRPCLCALQEERPWQRTPLATLMHTLPKTS